MSRELSPSLRRSFVAVLVVAFLIGQEIVLEHLGYCTEAQIRNIGEMGLKVSAQPNYIRVLGGAYSRGGLGTDRASLMNRLGSLERASVPLVDDEIATELLPSAL